MSETFKPIPKERAQQLRHMLQRAYEKKEALVIDRSSGNVIGTAPLASISRSSPTSGVNALGKFDTHYARGPQQRASRLSRRIS